MKHICPRKRPHCRFRTVALVAAAVAMMAFLPSWADTYQFINPATYPAPNVSNATASASTVLETSTRRVPAPAMALEARYRTIDESIGVALRSDELRGAVLIIR